MVLFERITNNFRIYYFSSWNVIGIASGNLVFILLSIVGGFILLALSKIIGLIEEINHKVLQVPFTLDQLKTIIKNSTQYYIESKTFNVYPDNETPYPLLLLDGEYYIRAKVFLNYMSQQEYEYKFELPDQQPIFLNISDAYYRGVELFAIEEQEIVMLRRINLKPILLGNRLILEPIQ